MSLLMDALKRAEESKQDASRQLTGAGLEPSLSLEPLPPQPAPTSPPRQANGLPELAEHIAALDADLAATAKEIKEPPPRPKPAPSEAQAVSNKSDMENRQAIRNAFAAKTTPAPTKHRLALVLGGSSLVLLVVGGYFWFQLQTMSGSSLGRPSVAPPPVMAVPPSPTPAAVAPPPPSQPVSTPLAEVSAPPIFPTPRSEPRVAEPAMLPEQSSPVRLTRSKPETDSHVAQGYRLLQAGALDLARREYELALRRDRHNVDALLGMAAIAQKEGRFGESQDYVQQAVEADPKDAGAQAALISASASADPVNAESRLKIQLAAQPESGPLNFALGNLYARQTRWAEAQSAYFSAVTADPDNPDYLFNLAVSLDQLRQPKPAAQHYRLALEAAEKRPAEFNQERVRRRLAQLAP